MIWKITNYWTQRQWYSKEQMGWCLPAMDKYLFFSPRKSLRHFVQKWLTRKRRHTWWCRTQKGYWKCTWRHDAKVHQAHAYLGSFWSKKWVYRYCVVPNTLGKILEKLNYEFVKLVLYFGQLFMCCYFFTVE